MSYKKLDLRGKKKLAQSAMRRNLASLVILAGKILYGKVLDPAPHVLVMVHFLERAMRGEFTRGIINAPPRSGKSTLASIVFAAFVLGLDPSKKVVVISYSAELATAHTNNFRRLVESPEYREIFKNVTLIKSTETEVQTSAGGYRLGISIEGSLTGRGADLIIIDDPLKADEAANPQARKAVLDVIQNTVVSRLDDNIRGIILCVMQRLHVDDLTASLQKTGGYETLSLPLIAEESQEFDFGNGRIFRRDPGDILDIASHTPESISRLRREIGEYNYSGQYQQKPIPPDGQIFKQADFRFYEELPLEDTKLMTLISWDVASTDSANSSYSAATVWKITRRGLYLIEVFRRKLEFPELRRAVMNLTESHAPAKTIIEKTGLGLQLIQDLQSKGRPVSAFVPRFNKLERAQIANGSVREGRVWLPKTAVWLKDYLDELLLFPAGTSDQVDSTSQALIEAEQIFRAGMVDIGGAPPIQVGCGEIPSIMDEPYYEGMPGSEPAMILRLAKKPL